MCAGLLTDNYELTMLAAALRDGTADRRTTFELFARRLPDGRRYGVVAGTGRFVEALPQFRFDDVACESLAEFLDRDTLAYLRDFRFGGDVDGYAEGELYFPGSPVLSVRGSFAECVVLETLALSIFNHDTAIASAAARMVSAAGGRPLIEMGSRRTHERAAVAAARAAYIAGFAGSSNLEAQRRYGVPARGHQRARVHPAARRPRRTRRAGRVPAQVDALGAGTTLLVDTYDVTTGVANAVAVAGTGLGAVRIDSGDLGVLARQVRAQLDGLGATQTRIVVSGDLDEFAIAGAARRTRRHLRRRHLAGHRIGRADGEHGLQAGRGGRYPRREAQQHKESHGGRKEALRLCRATGTITEEIVHPAGHPPQTSEPSRVLTVPLVRDGKAVIDVNLGVARDLVASGLRSLPWEGLMLSHGDPAIPTTHIPVRRRPIDHQE